MSIFAVTINAYEGRDIMFLDVPNVFIHTNVPPKRDSEERLIMKLTGVLVDMLVEMDSEMCMKHVMVQNGNKLIYVVVLRLICVMLVAELLL